MSDAAHIHLDELAQTPEYQARLRYKDAVRASDSLDDVTIGQLGHMFDTLKDAVLFMRHIADEPKLNVQQDHLYKHMHQSGLPSYLTRIASNFLVAGTFNRTDTGRVQEAKTHPDLSAFLNDTHGLMRKQNLAIGRTLVIPESLQVIVQQYDDMIDRYKQLLDKYKDPATGKKNYKNIPAEEMQAYTADFEPLADRLESELKALPVISIKIDGRLHHLPNTAPVNDRLKDTFPALVLLAYRTLGTGLADNNKRPAVLEYEKRQRELVGAQSMITDTIQGLFDLAHAHGAEFKNCDLDRKNLKRLVNEYTRSFQLALSFCRTADCGYELMYQDLERFIRMSDAKPTLLTLDNPQEAALMLYAVERRFAREDNNPALQKTLRDYADAMGNCETLELLQEKLGRDVQFQRTLQRSREIAEENGMTTVVDTLRQLNTLIPPVLGKGAHIGPPANPQDRALP